MPFAPNVPQFWDNAFPPRAVLLQVPQFLPAHMLCRGSKYTRDALPQLFCFVESVTLRAVGMDQTSVQGHIQSLQDAPKLRSMYFEYNADRWRWRYPRSLPEHFRLPASLTSLVLAPARFDDSSAQKK